jgi:hypothetical protein
MKLAYGKAERQKGRICNSFRYAYYSIRVLAYVTGTCRHTYSASSCSGRYASNNDKDLLTLLLTC